MRLLGIETSCDETAAAIVARDADGRGSIISNIVRSQLAEHAPYGGVVPELAARSHVSHLDHIIARAVDEAGMQLSEVDGIAATAGPGLIGGVLVGLTTAKALAAALDKPLIAVNHLEAHALTARLTDGLAFPYLLLLVSGGHSQFVLVRGVGAYERWGTTIDDALGEAFDKVAKLLGLGNPGGPEVERQAALGDPTRFRFPRPLLKEHRLDFSFSGLKTAVRLAAEQIAPLTPTDVADICAGFQRAVTEIVATRSRDALERFRQSLPDVGADAGGGRRRRRQQGDRHGAARCGGDGRGAVRGAADRAVHRQWRDGRLGRAERLALGDSDGFAVAAKARWPLDSADMGRHHAV